ncbi:MAG: serine hydrolase domain-containing protein [Pseudoxanthomonas sp.]
MRSLLLLLLMTSVPALAETRFPTGAVDKMMEKYAGDAPGASVLVLRDGVPLLRKAYGLADRELSIAATPATNYRLASVTKQFTAAAVMLLVEEGRIGLEDSVRRWLPSLPAYADAITVRHLLTHSSGLIDYEDVMPADFTGQLHDADVLRLLETQQQTYFPPGAGYRYSNSGYALLALMVERASGQTFPDFLQLRIFRPLGMAHTLAFMEGGPAIADRAYGYSGSADGWVRTDQSTTSAVLGDGGIYSSLDDLSRWDAALYDDRLLSDESRKLMFTPHVNTDQPDIRYGFGWRITGETLWHSGESIGFRNVIVRYPQRRLTVIVLTNRDDPEPYAMAKAIAELAIGQER